MVRRRAGAARRSYRGETGRTHGGKIMTPVSALLIFVALILFVLAQLFLKHAMEDDLRSARFKKKFAIGLSTMTVSFFINLGLLHDFALRYLYPYLSLRLF